MSTLREYQEAKTRRQAEQRGAEETCEARHARYLTDARANGIRNLSADDYRRVAEMVAKRLRTTGSVIVPWPLDAPIMFNGGEPCDMWTGPCSCGATHTEGI